MTIPSRRDPTREEDIHPGPFWPPMTRPGTLFRPESSKNRPVVLDGGCFRPRLAVSPRNACQKSAGIDQLRVEKSGHTLILDRGSSVGSPAVKDLSNGEQMIPFTSCLKRASERSEEQKIRRAEIPGPEYLEEQMNNNGGHT